MARAGSQPSSRFRGPFLLNKELGWEQQNMTPNVLHAHAHIHNTYFKTYTAKIRMAGSLAKNSQCEHFSIFLFVNISLSVCLLACLSTYLSLYLSVYLPTYLCIYWVCAVSPTKHTVLWEICSASLQCPWNTTVLFKMFRYLNRFPRV